MGTNPSRLTKTVRTFCRGYIFRVTLFLAIAFSLVSVISGLIATFYLDWASGGTIGMFTLIVFLLYLLVTRD